MGMDQSSWAASDLDDAPVGFLRHMMGIGGRILDDLADDVPSEHTLEFISGSARQLLEASAVEVEVVDRDAPEGSSRRTVMAGRRDHETGRAPIELAIGHGTRVDAVLRIWWSDDPSRPTDLDRAVAARFSRMVLLVVDRSNTRRDQVLAVTREREALAGEIHDDPIQMMTAASLELQLVATRLDEAQRPTVEAARATVEEAIEGLRHIMYSLHPPTLDEDGLGAALEAYCETYVEPLGLGWVLHDTVGDVPLPLEVAALAFRLARGAIVNAVKHAEGTEIAVHASIDGQRLVVEISDDGKGFDLSSLSHTPVGHFGITHAMTLARWLGGSYVTESTVGVGTVVTVDLPLR
jgi:signal transduction histidine kinase